MKYYNNELDISNKDGKVDEKVLRIAPRHKKTDQWITNISKGTQTTDLSSMNEETKS